MNKKIDWKKINEDTAAIIFNEVQIEKEQIIKSLESTRQKSTVLLSVCLGLFTFISGQIDSVKALIHTPVTILLIGLFTAFCFFMGGLWPRKFKSMGSMPSRLLVPEAVEHGVKQLYSSMIVSSEEGLKQNQRAAKTAAHFFFTGYITLFITLAAFLAVLLITTF